MRAAQRHCVIRAAGRCCVAGDHEGNHFCGALCSISSPVHNLKSAVHSIQTHQPLAAAVTSPLLLTACRPDLGYQRRGRLSLNDSSSISPASYGSAHPSSLYIKPLTLGPAVRTRLSTSVPRTACTFTRRSKSRARAPQLRTRPARM